MAMDMNAQGGAIRSEINVTPLVDVVLVLLIIFMVVTPLLQMGYDVRVPPKVETNVPPPPGEQIIVRLDIDGRIFINKEMLSESDFPARLQAILKGGKDKLVFFAAAGDLPYDRVVRFMDLCRDNGAEKIGIVFDEIAPS